MNLKRGVGINYILPQKGGKQGGNYPLASITL